MFHGEFESMSLIHASDPTLAPRPIAWGASRDLPAVYFFLCEFIDMDLDSLPRVAEFCFQMAKLHRGNVSPTGMFGFHVTTCNGNIRQRNEWQASWEISFSNAMRDLLDLDVGVNGVQPELSRAMDSLFEVVIPRLLRPLQECSNPIKPVLVHGDLWQASRRTR